MEIIGTPLTIQNTDGMHWLITWPDCLAGLENVSFTVAVPRGELTIGEIEQQAIRRAIELLQMVLKE